jgi:hypothetical protein
MSLRNRLRRIEQKASEFAKDCEQKKGELLSRWRFASVEQFKAMRDLLARVEARISQGSADLTWAEILKFATDDELKQMAGIYEQLQTQQEGTTTVWEIVVHSRAEAEIASAL